MTDVNAPLNMTRMNTHNTQEVRNMANIGAPKRIVDVPEPIEAPTFTPTPTRREQEVEVPDWMNPNIATPQRERVLVPAGR